MTGEMHESEVTRESYPLHFAIADSLEGCVEPFDQYQGPYVYARGTRLWLMIGWDDVCVVYNERTERQAAFLWDDADSAVDAALSTF